jgi:hypothetical protein
MRTRCLHLRVRHLLLRASMRSLTSAVYWHFLGDCQATRQKRCALLESCESAPTSTTGSKPNVLSQQNCFDCTSRVWCAPCPASCCLQLWKAEPFGFGRRRHAAMQPLPPANNLISDDTIAEFQDVVRRDAAEEARHFADSIANVPQAASAHPLQLQALPGCDEVRLLSTCLKFVSEIIVSVCSISKRAPGLYRHLAGSRFASSDMHSAMQCQSATTAWAAHASSNLSQV